MMSSSTRGVLWIFFIVGVVMIESFAPSPSSRVVFHSSDHSLHRMSLSRRSHPSINTTSSLSTSLADISATSSIAVSTLQSTLHGSYSFVLSALLVVSSCGIATEQRTKFGKALSAPLVTMLLSLCLANLGIIPFYSNVCKYVIHLNILFNLLSESSLSVIHNYII